MTDAERVRIKKSHAESARILGFDHFGAANQKLYKIIILNLAQKLGKDICRCGKKVILDNFSLGHILPWRRCFSREGSADLFWSSENISLECRGCNTTDEDFRNERHIGKVKILPTEYECNKNVKDPTLRTQLNFDHDLLGMEFGKANHRLRQRIIFEWSVKLGQDNCFRCGKRIRFQDDYSIEHCIPWMSGVTNEEKRDLFFSISNLSQSHFVCNCTFSNIGKGISGYNGVSGHTDPKNGRFTWRAVIKCLGKSITIHHNTDIIKCAEAYDMAILKYRKGEGILNFPEKIDYYIDKIKGGWHYKMKCIIKGCNSKYFDSGYCKGHYDDPLINHDRDPNPYLFNYS